MLKSLKIENFRCFKSFELQQLGRINLLVGANNSGKTSILEALYLLTSPNITRALSSVMSERNEYIFNSIPNNNYELDFKHLFYGHEMDLNSKFSISDQNDRNITVSLIEDSELSAIHTSGISIELAIQDHDKLRLPLSSQGGFPLGGTYHLIPYNELEVETQYISSKSFNTREMISLFEEVLLEPEEELINQALRTIEPNFERIAPVSSGVHLSRAGFVVRLSNSKQRVPIGSMGDGMWRILGLALAIVNAKDGVLLVDEIDTGLHFTAMTDMWKMIWETAKRLNVQVFATTHSSDCWQSLAEIINEDHHEEHKSEDGITIHRIEKDTPCSIIFSEEEIAIAAEQNIEVR